PRPPPLSNDHETPAPPPLSHRLIPHPPPTPSSRPSLHSPAGTAIPAASAASPLHSSQESQLSVQRPSNPPTAIQRQTHRPTRSMIPHSHSAYKWQLNFQQNPHPRSNLATLQGPPPQQTSWRLLIRVSPRYPRSTVALL